MTAHIRDLGRCPVHIEGHGPAVVLLHSTMGSKRQWRHLVEQLRGRFRTIAVDLLGYGDAPMPLAATFSLADETTHVERVLAGVLSPHERFHLVGHSYGGGVALRLAHDRPSRLHSLTLFEPTAFHLLPDADALAELRAVAAVVTGAAEGDRLAATACFIDFWSGAGTFAALAPSRQQALARLLPKAALDFQALFGAPQTLSDIAGLDQVLPTLLLGGQRSPGCTQALLLALAGALPDARVCWVPSGHMAPVSDPALVDPLIEAFIAEADAARRSLRDAAAQAA
ncbi:alpha/beta hydrolase [Piscinibacter sp. XHJ-5]|uniref:alpha/beta fold hydrolase n=1 Tax=Piscinibacter sp. XHJ-5 TaxID=3037797 RepID=UPI002452E8F5|nr:alpha/beta hydrolase [Piscinibacter sp. XHJ-5]